MHMIGKKTSSSSSYDRYKGKNPGIGKGLVTGQHYETTGEKSLDVPKTKSSDAGDSTAGLDAGANRHRYMNPNRPSQQNRYNTIPGASLGKAKGWQVDGDR